MSIGRDEMAGLLASRRWAFVCTDSDGLVRTALLPVVAESTELLFVAVSRLADAWVDVRGDYRVAVFVREDPGEDVRCKDAFAVGIGCASECVGVAEGRARELFRDNLPCSAELLAQDDMAILCITIDEWRDAVVPDQRGLIDVVLPILRLSAPLGR